MFSQPEQIGLHGLSCNESKPSTAEFGVTYYNSKPEYYDLKQYADLVVSVALNSL